MGFLFPLETLKHGEEKSTDEKSGDPCGCCKMRFVDGSFYFWYFWLVRHIRTHTHIQRITWQAHVFMAQHQEMGVPLPTEKIRAIRQRWGIRPSLSLSGALARTTLTQIISRSSELVLHCGCRQCCRKNRLKLLLFMASVV